MRDDKQREQRTIEAINAMQAELQHRDVNRMSMEDLTDEEKRERLQEEQEQAEQERILDPLTNDRGDPYRNVRDTDQNGQYDYMEDDRCERGQ